MRSFVLGALCPDVLTTITQGVMKNQHALHHSQKVKLLFPIIISMSLIKRFPPRIHQKNTQA